MDPFGLTPQEEARIAAEALRSQQVLGGAARRGARFDNLAAISPLVNNDAVLQSATGAQARAVAQAKPNQLGNMGFMVDGQFAGNPAYMEEKLLGRAQQRGLTAAKAEEAARAQRERLEAAAERAEADRTLRAQLASDANQTRMLVAGIAAQGREKKEDKGRTLPVSAINKLTTAQETAESYADFLDTWKPEFSGPVGAGSGFAKATNLLGRFGPGVVGEPFRDQANWWQNYNAQANRIRNELFGSALTLTEQKLFEEANILPGMTPDMIERRLKQQKDAAASASKKMLSNLGKAGYDVSGFESGDVPAAAPQVLTFDPATGEFK